MPEQDTALARRRPLPAEIAECITRTGMNEQLVRAALNVTFKGCPAEQVVVALERCAKYGLDPLAGHIVVFRPKKNEDKWVPWITYEGRIAIATAHPDYQGITFSAARDDGQTIEIDAFIHRRGWKPSGPWTGKAKKTIQKRDGGEFDHEWPLELARTRAVRNGLKAVFGNQVAQPDDDDRALEYIDVEPGVADAEPAPMRDDQRRTLFALANRMGWSREERLAAAGVPSMSAEAGHMTEELAATLILEWTQLVAEKEGLDEVAIQHQIDAEVVRVNVETGEVIDVVEASPEGPDDGRRAAAASAPAGDRRAASAASPASPAEGEEPAGRTAASPPQVRMATHTQKRELAIIAYEMEWDDAERLRRLGVRESSDELTYVDAQAFLLAWRKQLADWTLNRRSRLTSECVARGLDVGEVLIGAGIDPPALLDVGPRKLNEVIRSLPEAPPASAGDATPSPAAPAPPGDDLDGLRSELRRRMDARFTGPLVRRTWLQHRLAEHGIEVDAGYDEPAAIARLSRDQLETIIGALPAVAA